MMATLDASSAANMATHRATLLNPEEPTSAAEGAGLGDAALGEAVGAGDASSAPEAVGTDVDAVDPGVGKAVGCAGVAGALAT